MSDLSTLIDDIDALIKTGNQNVPPNMVDEALEGFVKGVAKVALDLVSPKTKDLERPYLRPSNLGTPDRKLWFILNSEPRTESSFDPAQLRSFAFGSILECLLVFLTKASGHEVSEEQAEVDVYGVKGNKDLRIDGITVDAKSVSPYVWEKWANGEFLRNPEADMFGYREQLSLYTENDEPKVGAWFVVNKSSGALALTVMDEFDRTRDVKALVARKRAVEAMPSPPEERCYAPVPFGKSENLTLAKGCGFCAFKKPCWSDKLRAFRYSDGIKYFTHVAKAPNVEEVILN